MNGNGYDYDVLLSYASADRDWAKKLAERPESRKVKIWIDLKEIKPGEDRKEKFREGIRKSRKVACFFSSGKYC